MFLLRRRNLGKGSCEGISKFSQSGLKPWLNTKPLPEETAVVIRWGCTSKVPHGAKVFNQAHAIHAVTDKAGFRALIQTPQFPVWREVDGIEYPAILRPVTHHQGRHVHLAYNEFEAETAIAAIGREWYAAPYIPKVAEFRVFVVQGRVAAVANKIPAAPDAIAWNMAQGGKFENVRWGNWPISAVAEALRAFAFSGLDFGGVDVMVDQENRAYTLEINSAPSLTSEYRQQCMAKCFDHMVTDQVVGLVNIDQARNWKHVIHPAIWEKS